MKFLLGTKKHMSQIFLDDGTVVPVTIVRAEPNTVTAIKSKDKDGYVAIQIGHGQAKERRTNKAQREQWKELGRFKTVKEQRRASTDGVTVGQKIDVTSFAVGDTVQVTGTSKGRGFAGVVKRHHFRGGPASHGHKDNLRAPGSIGATFPQHVLKGTRMAGRLGNAKVTVTNLKVMAVDPDKHELTLGGAVPGPFNGKIIIQVK